MPFLRETFKLLGFTGAKDLLGSAFGLKAYTWPLLKIQVSGTLLAVLLTFLTRWVWDPPGALLVLIALDLLNARYGFLVAKKLKGEGFKWEEFQRTFGKVTSTLILLALLKNTINAYPYYSYAADGLFAWLFTYKMRKLAAKMVALKVQEGGLPKILLGLLSSKYAPYVVDSLQKKEEEEAAAPAADTQPVTP